MIDLRSDTVTRPSAEMMHAMMDAGTGDDVYGEDPTVNQLEAMAAELTGMEAGLFVTSGTQGNLLALLSHCQRGDEYIAGQDAHAYRYEGGGAAVLGGIQPQPLPFNERGEIDLEEVEAVIKPDDSHFAITRLLCLENTQAGKVLSLDYMKAAREFATEHDIGFHLDGARVFNASVRQQVPVATITSLFDSVSICLSKGLAAPVGSVLVGNRDIVDSARRLRKMVGGGMRQAGIIAAAGIHALTHHVDRLAEDHRHATELAEALKQMENITLGGEPETNMVMLDIAPQVFTGLRSFLEERNIILSSQRLVLHRDITDDDLAEVITAFRQFNESAA